MSGLSKKDYEVICNAVVKGVLEVDVRIKSGMIGAGTPSREATLRLICGTIGGKLAEKFAEDNPRFNVIRFAKYLNDTFTINFKS